jgi:hypothetical protein
MSGPRGVCPRNSGGHVDKGVGMQGDSKGAAEKTQGKQNSRKPRRPLKALKGYIKN